jgi:hypothetical protein
MAVGAGGDVDGLGPVAVRDDHPRRAAVHCLPAHLRVREERRRRPEPRLGGVAAEGGAGVVGVAVNPGDRNEAHRPEPRPAAAVGAGDPHRSARGPHAPDEAVRRGQRLLRSHLHVVRLLLVAEGELPGHGYLGHGPKRRPRCDREAEVALRGLRLVGDERRFEAPGVGRLELGQSPGLRPVGAVVGGAPGRRASSSAAAEVHRRGERSSSSCLWRSRPVNLRRSGAC